MSIRGGYLAVSFGLLLALPLLAAWFVWDFPDPWLGVLMGGAIILYGAGGIWESNARHRYRGTLREVDSIVLWRRGRYSYPLALCTFMTGGAFGFAAYSAERIGAFEIAILFLMVFFIGMGVMLLTSKKARKDTVALRVDEQGISFGKHVHPLIPWENLGGGGIVSSYGNKLLGFHVRDSDSLEMKKGAMDKVWEGLGLPTIIHLQQSGLEVSLEEVAGAVERLRKRYKNAST